MRSEKAGREDDRHETHKDRNSLADADGSVYHAGAAAAAQKKEKAGKLLNIWKKKEAACI